MKRRNLFWGMLVMALTLVLALSGCAMVAKAITYDTGIPLEEQAQVRIGDYLTATSFDGKPVSWGTGFTANPVINVPAGEHTFTFNFYVEYGGYTYSANGIQYTDTFQAGRLYSIHPNWGGGTVRIFTNTDGYNEFKKPGPTETIVVFRRGSAGLISGYLVDIIVDGDKDHSYDLTTGQTVAILLPEGEHKLIVDGEEIVISAGGGTKKIYQVSTFMFSLFKKTTVKEVSK
jgi:hypothetical protein